MSKKEVRSFASRVPKCDFCGNKEIEISINNKNIHLCTYCYLDRKYLDKKGGD